LILLRKEFPELKSFKLPSYQIEYANKGKYLKLKLFIGIPKIIRAVRRERSYVNQIVEDENIDGIISDSRLGVINNRVPCVYISHQLNVLSGHTTWLTSKIHQKFIRKFNECWIPDFKNEPNFSGKLGHLKKEKFKIRYLGILSRFKPAVLENKYDLMVILSGPEPQRTLLENRLLKELTHFKGKILFIRGVFSNQGIAGTIPEYIQLENYRLSHELELAYNESNTVIARSGYSTIMDLAAMGKKAFFIPTPGQTEQEYLAKKFDKSSVAPQSSQDSFRLEKLLELKNYSGFDVLDNKLDSNLFELFNGK
jgi:uncharacterized protein (TIGR00661 family)